MWTKTLFIHADHISKKWIGTIYGQKSQASTSKERDYTDNNCETLHSLTLTSVKQADSEWKDPSD